MSKDKNKEIDIETRKLMATEVSDIIDNTIQAVLKLADKYGDDRNKCVDDVIKTMHVSSMFVDFNRFTVD